MEWISKIPLYTFLGDSSLSSPLVSNLIQLGMESGTPIVPGRICNDILRCLVPTLHYMLCRRSCLQLIAGNKSIGFYLRKVKPAHHSKLIYLESNVKSKHAPICAKSPTIHKSSSLLSLKLFFILFVLQFVGPFSRSSAEPQRNTILRFAGCSRQSTVHCVYNFD